MNQKKQARHMPGSEGYIPGRSYITVSADELQEIVNQYAGTGEILHGGRAGVRELIQIDRTIGYDVARADGAKTETSRAILYYSATGVHVVPTLRKFKEEA